MSSREPDRPVVKLADLSRTELENFVLNEHGLMKRVLEAIRAGTKPEWKVRREVEALVDEAYENEERWRQWQK
jgi:hypothetical protein